MDRATNSQENICYTAQEKGGKYINERRVLNNLTMQDENEKRRNVLLGKKTKSGLARYLALFCLLLSVFVTNLIEKSHPYQGNLFMCKIVAAKANHTKDLIACMLYNTDLRNEFFIISSYKVFSNKTHVFGELNGHTAKANVSIEKAVANYILHPKLDVLDCTRPIEQVQIKCY